MKIYFLINGLYESGGTERVTTILANNFLLKHQVGIIALHNGGAPFFSIDERVDLLYLHEKRQTNIYLGYLSNVYRINKIVRKKKIDLLIDVCSAMSLMSIPATCFTACKVVTWEHFNAKVNWNRITSPLARKLAAFFSKQIVVLTNTDKEVYRDSFKAKNVIAIPNPITIDVSEPSSLQTKTVLAVGRFEEQKGFDMLLAAWQKCVCRTVGWRLRIIGSGTMKELLEKLLQEYQLTDSVMLDTPTTKMVEAYKQASIYVMSSRFEGLPLVLIEAMSMGLPLVSFDCETGPRDVIVHDKTGLLVEPNNIEQLANAVDKLATDEQLRLYFSQNALVESRKFELSSILQIWEREVLKK